MVSSAWDLRISGFVFANRKPYQILSGNVRLQDLVVKDLDEYVDPIKCIIIGEVGRQLSP